MDLAPILILACVQTLPHKLYKPLLIKVVLSIWYPNRTLKHLGYFIDTDNAILSIPVDRLSKLLPLYRIFR